MRPIDYELEASIRSVTGPELRLQAHIARGFVQQFLGLMGQDHMPSAAALVFPRCSSIHMYWMRFPIDAVWLGKPNASGECLVLRVDHKLQPRQVAFGPRGTWGVAELPAGFVPEGISFATLWCPALDGRK